MKKIKFACREGIYSQVEKSLINPIIKYLPEDSYEYSSSIFENGVWNDFAEKDKFNISFYSDIYENLDLFICHGIGDKNYRLIPNINKYKYIGVSGYLWIDKLLKQGISRDKIKVIGYSKLDPIFQDYKKIEHNDNKIHVLYAPTHNINPNNNLTVSSYPRLLNELNQLSDNIDVKISCHPANHDMQITFNNEYEWADVIIADAGSTIYEAWSLGIPVILPSWLCKNNVNNHFPNSFESYIYNNNNNIGYHANNIKHMEELILKANELGIDDKTDQFIEGIFPRNLRGNSGEITANLILELCKV